MKAFFCSLFFSTFLSFCLSMMGSLLGDIQTGETVVQTFERYEAQLESQRAERLLTCSIVRSELEEMLRVSAKMSADQRDTIESIKLHRAESLDKF
ncbi:MAG: hypothetical protein K2W82_17125 [Candidatus Obscuribacterales bacterium]|nr:hypothetical protein [Candidatus Obscuribacterales bacterium]